MAELKNGTTIGGAVPWTKATLNLIPSGDSINYKGYKIYTEKDKPTNAETDTVSASKGGDYTGLVNFNNGIYVKGKVSGLTINSNDTDIRLKSSHLTFFNSSNAQTGYFNINGGEFSTTTIKGVTVNDSSGRVFSNGNQPSWNQVLGLKDAAKTISKDIVELKTDFSAIRRVSLHNPDANKMSIHLYTQNAYGDGAFFQSSIGSKWSGVLLFPSNIANTESGVNRTIAVKEDHYTKTEQDNRFIKIGTGGPNPAFKYATGDHGFFEWFEGGTRTAVLGFAYTGSKDFEIRNYKSGGDIGFSANKVLVNNAPVVTEGKDGFHGGASNARWNTEQEFLNAARDRKISSTIFRNDQTTSISGIGRYSPSFLFKAGDTWANLSIDHSTGRLTTRSGNSSGGLTSPSRSYLFSDEVWTKNEADGRFVSLLVVGGQQSIKSEFGARERIDAISPNGSFSRLFALDNGKAGISFRDENGNWLGDLQHPKDGDGTIATREWVQKGVVDISGEMVWNQKSPTNYAQYINSTSDDPASVNYMRRFRNYKNGTIWHEFSESGGLCYYHGTTPTNFISRLNSAGNLTLRDGLTIQDTITSGGGIRTTVNGGSWASWQTRGAGLQVAATLRNGASSVFKMIDEQSSTPIIVFDGYSSDGTQSGAIGRISVGTSELSINQNKFTFNKSIETRADIFARNLVLHATESRKLMITTDEDNSNYISFHNKASIENANRTAFIGYGGKNVTDFAIKNDKTNTQLTIAETLRFRNLKVLDTTDVLNSWTTDTAKAPSIKIVKDELEKRYLKDDSDARYFASAYKETTTDVAWNKPSGIYQLNLGGSSDMVVNFFGGGGGSTPTLQLRGNYRNGGLWYRTARDAAGFEEGWTGIFTTKLPPSASQVGAYSKSESDNKYVIQNNTATIEVRNNSGIHIRGSGDYTAMGLFKSDGRRVNIETLPHSDSSRFLNFIYREASGSSITVVGIPRRNGTLAIASEHYTKGETYTRSEIDTKVNAKANSADVYKKTETYSKSESDSLYLKSKNNFVKIIGTSGQLKAEDSGAWLIDVSSAVEYTLPKGNDNIIGCIYHITTRGNGMKIKPSSGDSIVAYNNWQVNSPRGSWDFIYIGSNSWIAQSHNG